MGIFTRQKEFLVFHVRLTVGSGEGCTRNGPPCRSEIWLGAKILAWTLEHQKVKDGDIQTPRISQQTAKKIESKLES